MKVIKSSRHSKITGDFAESLILYWLSKHGFECALVDHTGIDIIARNPHTNEVMGISVKSRSREIGKEGQYVHILNEHFSKVETACKSFACIPYFAIVVDQGNEVFCFITKMEHLLELFPKKKTSSGWKMNKKWLKRYAKDKDIIYFKFQYQTFNWWK